MVWREPSLSSGAALGNRGCVLRHHLSSAVLKKRLWYFMDESSCFTSHGGRSSATISCWESHLLWQAHFSDISAVVWLLHLCSCADCVSSLCAFIVFYFFIFYLPEALPLTFKEEEEVFEWGRKHVVSSFFSRPLVLINTFYQPPATQTNFQRRKTL